MNERFLNSCLKHGLKTWPWIIAVYMITWPRLSKLNRQNNAKPFRKLPYHLLLLIVHRRKNSFMTLVLAVMK